MEEARRESRNFSALPGDDGRYVVKGRLDPEVGALLMRAVEAGTPVVAICRRLGIIETTFYRRRKVSGGLGACRSSGSRGSHAR